MKFDVITKDRIVEFANECKKLFATKQEVNANQKIINENILNIDYEKDLKFDIEELYHEDPNS